MPSTKQTDWREKFANLCKAFAEGKITEEQYRKLRDEYRSEAAVNTAEPIVSVSSKTEDQASKAKPGASVARNRGSSHIESGSPRVSRLLIGIMMVVSLISVSAYGYYQYRIATLERTLEESTKRLLTMNETVKSLEDAKLELARQVKHLNLSRPTIEQLRQFLDEDPTNKREWRRGSYICVNFATDLKKGAAAKGWNLSWVEVNFEVDGHGYGHAFNGAYLANGTHVYIEPQRDRIYFGGLADALKQDLPYLLGVNVYKVEILESTEVW